MCDNDGIFNSVTLGFLGLAGWDGIDDVFAHDYNVCAAWQNTPTENYHLSIQLPAI